MKAADRAETIIEGFCSRDFAEASMLRITPYLKG